MKFPEAAACDGRYIALLLATLCMITDMAVSRIYNFLTVPAMAAGIAVLIIGGRASLLPAAAGAAVLTVLVLFPFYRIHGIGAGDCKLLAALCFLLPLQQYKACILCSFVLGAAASAAVLLFSRGRCHHIHFAVPVGISVIFCIGGVLEPVYRYL